jgi:hypothetical protein
VVKCVAYDSPALPIISYADLWVDMAYPGFVAQMSSNWAVEEYVATRRRQGSLTKGDLIYQALESPASSRTALLIAVSLLLLSTASVLIAAIQMSLEAHEVAAGITCDVLPSGGCAPSASVLFDCVFLFIFGLEVILRAAVYIKPWWNLSLWVDLVCLVPLIMRLSLSAQGRRPLELADPARTISILVQALASLRLFKLMRYSSAAGILQQAILDSSAALWIPFYVLCVLFTFIGGVVYAFEYQPGADPNSGRVTTLLECWWMMLVRIGPCPVDWLIPALCPWSTFPLRHSRATHVFACRR